MSSIARFTGRVRMQSGAFAYGCRVRLRLPAANVVVAETWTSSRGEFVLGMPPGRMAAGDVETAGIVLDVVDGTGAVLASENVVARPGESTHLELTGKGRTGVTLPVALPLLRTHSGSMVRPEALAVIDAALALLAAPGSDAHAQYARAARGSLPPTGHVEELLELAWASLDGDPRAIADLREVLAVQAATVRRDAPMPVSTPFVEDDDRRRPKVAYGQPRDVAPKGPVLEPVTTTGRLLGVRGPSPTDTQEERHRDELETAVPTDRLMPLLVATVRVANNSGERVAFFDGLHTLLSGLSTVDRLHRAALEVLQYRRIAPMRALLALLLADVADASDLPLARSAGTHSAGADPLLPSLVDPWWERLQLGVRETGQALRNRDGSGYRIERIEPEMPQAGDTVVITGSGFGNAGGEVVFPGAPPVDGAAWSDTRIQVTVPEGAQPGLLSLRILESVVRVRRRIVEVYQDGTPLPFEGGRPQIRSILVDGHGAGSWVPPGDPVAVSWTAVAGRHGQVGLQVRLRTSATGAEIILFDEDGLPPSGSRILAIPDVYLEHLLVVRVRAEAGNAQSSREVNFPVAIEPRLKVEGLEVTQGVQRAPWDAAGGIVPTVTHRDTFVRAYISSDRDGFQDDRTRVTMATLRVADHALSPWTLETGDVPKAFQAGRASAIDRARRDDAITFRIPAAWCSDTRELHLEVSAEGSPPRTPTAEARVTWTWTPARAIAVRVVRLLSPSGEGPTLAEALTTVRLALDLLPTTAEDVGPAWLDTLVVGPDEDAVDVLARASEPSAWEWVAHEVDTQTRRAPRPLWVAVSWEGRAPSIAPERGVAIVPVCLAVDGVPQADRALAAWAIARLLDPDGDAERAARVLDVPFDPSAINTVVDTHHGVHDLGPGPGARWISGRRWRRLLERA